MALHSFFPADVSQLFLTTKEHGAHNEKKHMTHQKNSKALWSKRSSSTSLEEDNIFSS